MKNLRNKMKNMNGITLIALIITIVVLLILAGVAINLSMGENGIITKAQSAVEKYKEAQVKEQLELLMTEAKLKAMDEKQDFTVEYLKTIIETKLGDEVQAEIDENGALQVTLDGYTIPVNIENTISESNGTKWETATVNKVANITQKGQSYTFQNDGYVYGIVQSTDNRPARLFVDDVLNYATSYDSEASVKVKMYVKKGETISTRADYGFYDLEVYEINDITRTSTLKEESITECGYSYTFQNDGYIIGTAQSESGHYSAQIFIDNEIYFHTNFDEPDLYNISIYVEAGETIKLREDGGIYNINIYEFDKSIIK